MFDADLLSFILLICDKRLYAVGVMVVMLAEQIVLKWAVAPAVDPAQANLSLIDMHVDIFRTLHLERVIGGFHGFDTVVVCGDTHRL